MARASKSNSNDYISNGVIVNPAVPTVGEQVKIVYDGLLSKNGATDVLARIGYGNSWDNQYDYRMNRSLSGFEAVIPVSSADTLNICFKDCANNWDNNSGKNYTFDVTQ